MLDPKISERKIRTMLFILLAAIVVVFLATVIGDSIGNKADSKGGTIYAENFVLLCRDGSSCATLSLDKNESPMLMMRGPAGNSVGIFFNNRGEPRVTMMSGNGNGLISISIDHGSGEILISDSDGATWRKP